jgi:hypothetical protein
VCLPSQTQIGRYLHQWSCFRRKKAGQLQRQRPKQPKYVHQRWQLDFKLGIGLADGNQVNLHTVCDPVGETCIAALTFPAGQVGQAPKKVVLEQVRLTLRHCFAVWGTLPDELQTDGESSLVANRRLNDFPTPFTLWLKGLGIDHLVIRPGRPTDNAEVERMHHTLCDYVATRRPAANLACFQAELDQAVHDLTYELSSQAPGCAGKTPILAHPELLQPTHPFQPEWELACFNLDRVDAFLATLTWERRVGKTGQVDLGAHVYSVGRPYGRRSIGIHFDPATRELVFFDPEYPEAYIKRHPIQGLEVSDLLGYQLVPNSLCPQQLPLPNIWQVIQEGVSC